MSVKNEISTSIVIKGQLEQINFLALFTNAEIIAEESLKKYVKTELEQVKRRVNELKKAIEDSHYLPDKWLKDHVVKTIRRIPKKIPAEAQDYVDEDAQLFREIFREVRESLKSIRNGLDYQLQKELAQEISLFEEQQKLEENEVFINQLKTFSQTRDNTPPRVYMAFAWPVDSVKIKRREEKVQLFLKQLEKHLRHLGVIATLDIRHCPMGGSIYEYMKKKIEKSDVFLLFGTESLLCKMNSSGGIPLSDHHPSGYPLICYEVRQAYKKAVNARTRIVKLDRPVILPVLLTGNMDNSFPEYFQRNLNAIQFPEIGYLEGLKEIVYSLYGFQKQGKAKPIFDEEWTDWFEKGITPNERTKLDQDTDMQHPEEPNLIISTLVGREHSGDRVKEIKEKLLEFEFIEQELPGSEKKFSPLIEEIENLQLEPKKDLPKIAFGKADWEKYFGEVGEEPPLPPTIEEILKSSCPFWPNKRVEETHSLVLIPQTVNGAPLTLNSLSELIKVPKQGPVFQYRKYSLLVQKNYGTVSPSSSAWFLTTREVIPNSIGKNYLNQCKLVANYKNYEIPKLLVVAVNILTHYAKTGKELYSDEPFNCTRCDETVLGWPAVAGGFSRGGLSIDWYCYIFDIVRSVGMGASWKF